MKKKQFFLLLLLIVVNSTMALAAINQQQKLSGVVRDQTGEPLPGVNIVIVGTSLGTITDIDGAFSLNIPSDKSVLQFSLIGFTTKDVSVKGKTTIEVTLSEDTQTLDEVVVVGYGTQKKATLTGAVSTVSTKELTATPTSNVQNMLAGKLPGVRIQQRTGEPGSYDAKMDIRGMKTPLIVIDGIVREVSDFQRLEANDIESISVLKDASATVYGMRAADGVLLVTTRKGEKGRTKVEYTGSVGFQNPTGMPDVLNAYQYAELVREADKNMGRGINSTFTEEDVERYRQEGATDWYSLAMRNFVPQTHHNISASGSGERAQYFLSFGYLGEDGIWKTGDLNYHRYNIRTNLGFDVTDHLKAEVLISAMTDEKNQPYKDTWEQFKAIWMLKPTETPYANNNEDYPNDVMYGLNPLMITNADKSGYKRNVNRTLNTTFSLTYNAPFLKGLSAKFVYGFDYRNTRLKEFQKQFTLYKFDKESEVYNPQSYNSPSSIKGKSWEGMQNLLQASLNYERNFNDTHNLKVLFLYEQSAKEEDNLWAKRNFEMDAVDELFAGSEEKQIGTSDANQVYRTTNMGLIGRINYDYKSKYLLSLVMRADGYSRLVDNRWGIFPGVSAGWVFSKENFMQGLSKAISFAKLRASFGLNGKVDKNQIGYYTLQGAYATTTNYNGNSSYALNNVPNPALKWEKSRTFELGLDLSFLENRLSSNFTYYNRLTSDKYANINLPVSSGISSILTNNGKIRNQGLEVDLSAKIIQKTNWNWTM